MRRLLRQISNKKFLASLIILGGFLCTPVFAADGSMDILQTLGVTFHEAVSFLSWGWVFLAILAGKLMTNSFVYGSFMHLDIFLWQLWNIMKNFANYFIGVMFLVYLVKDFFNPKANATSFIKEKVVKFLVAGVLIQMSRFLLGAVMDISTIATSAIGSFPASLIEDNSTIQGDLAQELECLRGLRIKRDAQASNTQKFSSNAVDINNCVAGEALSPADRADTQNAFLDTILPSQDSLSGPFIFFGLSLFEFQDFSSLDAITAGEWESLLIQVGIQFAILVLYTIALFALFFINLVRVVVLWMVIAFSPFIILFAVLDNAGTMKINPFQKIEWLKIGPVIKMIFAPAIFTAFLSIMLVFVFAVWNLLNSTGSKSISEMEIYDTPTSTTIEIEDVMSTTIEGLQTGFADLIIYFAVIFLMWQLLKIGVKTVGKGGPGIIDKVLGDKGILGGISKIPTGLKILPGPNGPMSIDVAKEFMDKRRADVRKALPGGNIDDQNAAMRELLGLGKGWLNRYRTTLKKNINNGKDFFSSSRTIAADMEGISLSKTREWSALVTERLQSTNRPAREKSLLPVMAADQTLSDYFTQASGSVRAIDKVKYFADAMGVDPVNINTWAKLETYEFGKAT